MAFRHAESRIGDAGGTDSKLTNRNWPDKKVLTRSMMERESSMQSEAVQLMGNRSPNRRSSTSVN